MGVYIKGIDAPKNCLECPLVVCLDVKSDCPLVPVPPHGRLIDGDYLKHTHCAECTLYPDKCLEKTEDGCDWGSIIHLRMCPTIIEAEGEK